MNSLFAWIATEGLSGLGQAHGGTFAGPRQIHHRFPLEDAMSRTNMKHYDVHPFLFTFSKHFLNLVELEKLAESPVFDPKPAFFAIIELGAAL
jgi:hypothetical protein